MLLAASSLVGLAARMPDDGLLPMLATEKVVTEAGGRNAYRAEGTIPYRGSGKSRYRGPGKSPYRTACRTPYRPQPLHLLCDLYLGEAFCPGLRCSKTLPAASGSLSVPLCLGRALFHLLSPQHLIFVSGKRPGMQLHPRPQRQCSIQLSVSTAGAARPSRDARSRLHGASPLRGPCRDRSLRFRSGWQQA